MKRIISLLLALLLLLSLVLAVIPAAHAATGDEIRAAKKIISVVYDDSTSMYGDRWVYANYAMQALTALLNEQDELHITYMSQPTSSQQISLADINGAVTKVRNWNQAGDTPMASLVTAKKRLDAVSESDPSAQFWLVILTDGQIGTGDELKDALNDDFKGAKMSNGSRLNVAYLAMCNSKGEQKGDEKNGLYTFYAENANQITDVMAQMANLISSRLVADKVKQVDDTTITFTSDLPLYSIAILAQESAAKVVSAVNSDGPLNIDRNIPLDAREPFYNSMLTLRGNASVINLIGGTVSRVIEADTYTVTFSEKVDVKDIVVLYEPAIGVKMVVSRNGVTVTDTSKLANGDDVTIELIPVVPGTDKEISKNDLPKGISWNIEYSVGGNLVDSNFSNRLSGVKLLEGDNMIRGTMQLPGFAPSVFDIYFAIPPIVYDFGIDVNQPDPLTYYRAGSGRSQEGGSLTFHITNAGTPLTKEEQKELDLKLELTSTVCDDSRVTGFLNRLGKINAGCTLKRNDDGSYTLTPNPIVPFTSFLTKAGDYTVTVTLNRDNTVTATGKFTLEAKADDWFELLGLVISIAILWHLIFTLFIKYKFHGQEVRYRRYQLRDDNGGGIPLSGLSNNDSCTLKFARVFTPYNFFAFWERGCVYKFHDLTLVAGPGGTVFVSGKSIAKSVSHYGLSSDDPETRLKRINKSLDATEMVVDEEKGKTVRTAMDTPLSAETPIYFKTRPNDERIWSLYFSE